MRYFARLNAEGKTTAVESYSHGLEVAGAVEIPWSEYQDFINNLPVPVPVERKPTVEDRLKIIEQRLDAL